MHRQGSGTISLEYKPYDIDTGSLSPPSLADFLGSDDEVHIFREATERLDVKCLNSEFSGMGQHPHHPRMLLRLLMWGMANRVVSTRRIEILARRDVTFHLPDRGAEAQLSHSVPVPATERWRDKCVPGLGWRAWGTLPWTGPR